MTRILAFLRHFLATKSFVWVPGLALLVAVAPCVTFLLPNTCDAINESYEPVKTLKFIYSRGQAVHKWGPLPNLIYAPLYSVPLGYWKLTGQIGPVSSTYPYGLTRPHEQLGTLILLGRLTVLLAGLGAIALLALELERACHAPWVILVVLTILAATAPETVIALANTKPDGLMLAFATAALAIYLRIVTEGLTLRRGVWLSVLAVCSLSCKELTAVLFVFPYLGLAIDGWVHLRNDRAAWSRFRRDYAGTVAAGVAAYLVLNVVYAPGAWVERMRIVFGPLKDPAIWAPPDLTTSAYLSDALRGILDALGYAGTALLVLAVITTIVLRPPRIGLLWLPAGSHLVLTVLTAGYLPAYFFLPLAVAVSLPATLVGAELVRHLASPGRKTLALVGKAATLGLVLLAVWAGLSQSLLYLAANSHAMLERYVSLHVRRSEVVYPVVLWPRLPGSSRLSYLGHQVEDRPLFAIMEAAPGERPHWLFLDKEAQVYLAEFKQRPARAAMWQEDTGFDYRKFDDPESLGYRLVDVVRPEVPAFCVPAFVPGRQLLLGRQLLVYRNTSVPHTP